MQNFAYPIFLNLKNKNALVVGGGQVAVRKIKRLLKTQAVITVVSKKAAAELQQLAEQNKLKLEKREFKAVDLDNKFLCIAATGNRKVNSQIANLAKKKGVLVNVVDTPLESSFIVPSVVERGSLMLAISTNGQFPGLAKKIRQQLEKEFGPEYSDYLDLLAKVRQEIKTKISNKEQRKQLYNKLFSLPLLKEIKSGRKPPVSLVLNKLVQSSWE